MMMIVVTGCATTTATDTGCLWTREINPSRYDVFTAGTRDQIIEHNMTRERVCGR